MAGDEGGIFIASFDMSHLLISSMSLESSDSGHHHHHVRLEARVTALDVEEFLQTDLRSTASLSHCRKESEVSRCSP